MTLNRSPIRPKALAASAGRMMKILPANRAKAGAMVQPIWVLLSGSSSSPAAISADHDNARNPRLNDSQARRCRARAGSGRARLRTAEGVTTGDNGVVGLAHSDGPGTGAPIITPSITAWPPTVLAGSMGPVGPT